MRIYFLAAAALVAATSASPATPRPQARQATTASERLGLTWLGGNSSLPKILYALLSIHTLYSTADTQ